MGCGLGSSGWTVDIEADLCIGGGADIFSVIFRNLNWMYAVLCFYFYFYF